MLDFTLIPTQDMTIAELAAGPTQDDLRRLTHERVTGEFARRFGRSPVFIVRAPGRVNLIGEHTDYNEGWVLPLAIDRAVWIALRPRPDRRVVLHALDMGETAAFGLDALQRNQSTWLEYVKGVAHALQAANYTLAGWEGVMAGDVPVGAGLSSSAALEMAAARAFMAVTQHEWQPEAMARVGQMAENQWMGVHSGIMDQMISAAGRPGHALLIDCRTLATAAVPLPAQATVVVLDTGTRRGLVDSAYNERRRQCEAAARFFGAPALRDVALVDFQRRADELNEVVGRRARHVLTENGRVLQAAEAMRRGDAVTLGRLMQASHVSLREDFEVSSPALDTMVGLALGQPGCYGARMTGAGFGGCAVALVDSRTVEGFVSAVRQEYQAVMKLTPEVYICQAAAGAERVL